MQKSLLVGAISTLTISSAAMAEVPSVAVDIPPVHSLVSIVMEGIGAPDLIMQAGASPHGYSLRPSEAAALQRANLVFWISEDLTPWLEGPIKVLASDAKSVELLETEGTTELEFRDGATFEANDDDDEQEHEEDHAHHGHDPHAWLDPENARVWLDVIASDLAAIDPEHADAYAANAAAGKADLDNLINEINMQLDGFHSRNFIVFHDAYQYFENRFNIFAAGSIMLGDASDPSPARIAEVRKKVKKLGVSCAFSEPHFNPGLMETVFRGTNAKTGMLDPLGADLELGPDLYPQLLRNMANNLIACLK